MPDYVWMDTLWVAVAQSKRIINLICLQFGVNIGGGFPGRRENSVWSRQYGQLSRKPWMNESKFKSLPEGAMF